MTNVPTRFEKARGCGYRKVGGLYIVTYSPLSRCPKLPVPLTVCPTCNQGIKPGRGWAWVDGGKLLGETRSAPCTNPRCSPACPMSTTSKVDISNIGLLWVGEKAYPLPSDFMLEAFRMGISRRINFVPKKFKVGEGWVALAHRKAIINGGLATGEITYTPGIFFLFQPQAIEVVCDGTETDEEIEKYRKRGLTPVIVKQDTGTQQTLLDIPPVG